MENKKASVLLWTLLILGVIVVGAVSFVYVRQAVLPTLGCQFIENADDPSLAYTDVLESSSYTCQEDECIVSGVMTLTKSSGQDRVVFRYDGDYTNDIYVDSSETGQLVKWEYYITSTASPRGDKLSFKTPNYFDIYLDSSGSYQYLYIHFNPSAGSNDDETYRYRRPLLGNYPTSSQYGGCPNLYETCGETSSYEGTFNFCPLTDPNFPFCGGTQNSVISYDSGVSHYTDEKKLIRNDVINFDPKYADGSSVQDKLIRVKEYDCSCIPAVTSGQACSSEQLLCQRCPSGYEFRNRVYCQKLDGEGSYKTLENVCFKQSGSECLSNVGNYYQRCDATQQIGQATCGAFGTEATCPGGQKCFLDSNDQIGEGIGGCKCPADPCILGEKEATGTNTYKECITIGGCLEWSSERTCDQGLIFDDDNDDCVCDSSNSCSPTEAECINNQILKCEKKIYGGKTCYQWQSSVQSCPGELECWDKDTSELDDICSCEGINECDAGQIECISLTTYKECSKDPQNPTDTCFKLRDLGGTVGQFQQCKNNQIEERGDIGCDFNTPGFECDTSNFEECVNNECLCVQDDDTSDESSYLSNSKRCKGNTIQKTQKHGDCYRWETDETCIEDFVCVQQGNDASCIAGFEFVGIFTNSPYGVDKPIENITVIVTDDMPGGKVNQNVIARLLDGTNILKQVNTLTDGQGKAQINFDYTHPRIGELTIEVSVGETGNLYQQTKTINIEKTLQIKLSCPAQGFIGRDISCSWKVQDADTKDLITATPSINVMQGGEDISYTPLGIDKLKFVSDIVGSVEVIVSADKEGYIGTLSQTSVSIQPTQQQQLFNIDNADFFSYAGVGITDGTHQLELVAEESGTLLKVLSIDAEIRTPSGQIVPLTFNEVSTGKWSATYNFEQVGTTYTLRGTTYFEDIEKEPIPFEYTIPTLSGTTQKEQSYINLIIIGVAVVVGLILIFVIIALLRRRKR